MDISEQLEKEKKIKQEVNRIKKLYKDIDKSKTKVLEGLISQAAFMKNTLEELRDDLLHNGTTEWFEQGEQCFKRERPEYKVYATFIQRYSTVMKQLIDILPEEVKKEEDDELMSFVKKGKALRK